MSVVSFTRVRLWNVPTSRVPALHSQENAAVKLAIAESVLTSEASQLLSDEGVDLTVLKDKNRINSKTTLIIKNLPAASSTPSHCPTADH